MTDDEVIEQFSRLVRKTLEVRGHVHFTARDLQETSVAFDNFRLTKGFFVNGETHWSVFSYIHNCRVMFETSGGPGIFGVGDAKNDYDIEAMMEVLPVLRAETLLDLLADL